MKGLFLSLLVCVALVGSACSKNPVGPSDTPTITTFTADSLSVKAGTAVTLRWDVTPSTAEVRVDPSIGNVPVLGSATVILNATTTFTLNARSPTTGSAVQRVLTVVVTP